MLADNKLIVGHEIEISVELVEKKEALQDPPVAAGAVG